MDVDTGLIMEDDTMEYEEEHYDADGMIIEGEEVYEEEEDAMEAEPIPLISPFSIVQPNPFDPTLPLPIPPLLPIPTDIPGSSTSVVLDLPEEDMTPIEGDDRVGISEGIERLPLVLPEAVSNGSNLGNVAGEVGAGEVGKDLEVRVEFKEVGDVGLDGGAVEDGDNEHVLENVGDEVGVEGEDEEGEEDHEEHLGEGVYENVEEIHDLRNEPEESENGEEVEEVEMPGKPIPSAIAVVGSIEGKEGTSVNTNGPMGEKQVKKNLTEDDRGNDDDYEHDEEHGDDGEELEELEEQPGDYEHGNQEDEEEDDDDLPLTIDTIPPILLHLPNLEPRVLFAALPDDEEALNLSIWLADRQLELVEAKLSEVWVAIRKELEREGYGVKGAEMVIVEKQTNLRMGEVSLQIFNDWFTRLMGDRTM